MICESYGDTVFAETLPLHKAVKGLAKDRPRLQVILAVAEHRTSLANEGSPTPKFFQDQDNLVALKERAKQARELHRQVLVYVKAFRYREYSFPNDMERIEEASIDEVGHPASFLSIEMRQHLHSIGIPVGKVSTTYWRHLERPQHVELALDILHDDYLNKAIQSINQTRPIELYESPEGHNAGRRSKEALDRVRSRVKRTRERVAKEDAK